MTKVKEFLSKPIFKAISFVMLFTFTLEVFGFTNFQWPSGIELYLGVFATLFLIGLVFFSPSPLRRDTPISFITTWALVIGLPIGVAFAKQVDRPVAQNSSMQKKHKIRRKASIDQDQPPKNEPFPISLPVDLQKYSHESIDSGVNQESIDVFVDLYISSMPSEDDDEDIKSDLRLVIGSIIGMKVGAPKKLGALSDEQKKALVVGISIYNAVVKIQKNKSN